MENKLLKLPSFKEKRIPYNKETFNLDFIKDKYYTPDIEDLRIGYECEMNSSRSWKAIQEDIWIKHIIGNKDYTIIADTYDGSQIDEVYYALAEDKVRTEYLTKENIESKEWQYLEQQGPIRDYLDFVKKVDTSKNTKDTLYPYDIYLQYNFKTKNLDIYNDDDLDFEYYFQGECKSINELKTISKLLHI